MGGSGELAEECVERDCAVDELVEVFDFHALLLH